MRMAWAVVLSAVLASGCLSSIVPEHQGQTNTQGSGGGGNGGGVGSGGSTDMGMSGGGGNMPSHDLAGGTGADLAGTPAGSLQFGQTCATGTDCASGFCEPANMGTTLECTQQCNTPGAADPTCPNQLNGSPGFCNGKGFCKP